MINNNVIEINNRDIITYALTEMLRTGVQQLIQQASTGRTGWVYGAIYGSLNRWLMAPISASVAEPISGAMAVNNFSVPQVDKCSVTNIIIRIGLKRGFNKQETIIGALQTTA